MLDKIKALPPKLQRIIKINGCTMFLEGSHSSCCDLHDFDYGIGLNRKTADTNLKNCVRCVRKQQYEKDVTQIQAMSCAFCRGIRWICFWLKYKIWMVLAVAMYFAVRTFGWYFYGIARHKREECSGKPSLWPFYKLKQFLMPK